MTHKICSKLCVIEKSVHSFSFNVDFIPKQVQTRIFVRYKSRLNITTEQNYGTQ